MTQSQSRLDAALARLTQGGNDDDWLALYAAFAVHPVVLALEAEAAPGAPVRPMLLPLDSGPTALGFDSEARMAAFIDRPTDRAVLPGADLAAALAGQGVALALNPGTPGAETVLDPEALAWVAAHFGAEVATAQSAGARLRSPRAPEPALLEALAQRLAELGPAVAEAWLCALHQNGADELVLILRSTVTAPEIVEEFARDLTRIGQIASAQPFAVSVLAPGAAALPGARLVGIGLVGP